MKIPLKDSTVKTQARAMDIKELSKEELESLRENDPFMYYSFPGIRMATIFGNDINASDKGRALCLHVSDGQQEPAFKKAKTASSKSTTTVLRQTRISFEAPMDLGYLLVDNEVNEEDEFDVLDALMMLLLK